MSASSKLLGVLLCAALLVGCGQKGPLYLPKSLSQAPFTAPMTSRP